MAVCSPPWKSRHVLWCVLLAPCNNSQLYNYGKACYITTKLYRGFHCLVPVGVGSHMISSELCRLSWAVLLCSQLQEEVSKRTSPQNCDSICKIMLSCFETLRILSYQKRNVKWEVMNLPKVSHSTFEKIFAVVEPFHDDGVNWEGQPWWSSAWCTPPYSILTFLK